MQMRAGIARWKKGESGVLRTPAGLHDRVEKGSEARPLPPVDDDDRPVAARDDVGASTQVVCEGVDDARHAPSEAERYPHLQYEITDGNITDT